jgi:hypothetical protein
MILSWIYALYGKVGIVSALFVGLKAAVLAIVLEAVVRIGKRALKNRCRPAVARRGWPCDRACNPECGPSNSGRHGHALLIQMWPQIIDAIADKATAYEITRSTVVRPCSPGRAGQAPLPA